MSKRRLTVREIKDKFVEMFKSRHNKNVEISSSLWDNMDDDDEYLDQLEGCHTVSVYEKTTARLSLWERPKLLQFGIDEMTNCCGIAVLTETWVKENKYFRELHELAEDVARSCDYSSVISTDIDTGRKDYLKSCRWKTLNKIENKRTGNDIYVVSKNL